jgi:hypothetical protein
VQASSRVWASPLAATCNKAALVSSSTSRISGEAALIVPLGQCALEGWRRARPAREPLLRQRRPDGATKAPPLR